jgi:hypothetical protein
MMTSTTRDPMLRSFGQIVTHAVTYPAIVFWFAFLGAPAGALSAVFCHLINSDPIALTFPTPTQLFEEEQCLFLLKVGCLVSTIAMGFVGHRTHVVFRHLARRRRCTHYFVIGNDFLVVCCVVGLCLVAFLPFLEYPRLYTVALLAYLFVALVFHVMIDYAAHVARRFVPYSIALDFMAAISGVAGAAACLFGMENVSLVRMGSGLLVACFVIVHLKYIFAGANLLGARFIPNAVRCLDDKILGMPRSSSSGSGFLS